MCYFHVSPVEGLTELDPRVPYDAAWGEPAIPRVCAAPTFEQCILATGDFDILVIVYAIDLEPDVDNIGVVNWPTCGKNGGEVGDAKETGEVWYLRTVPCREVGRMAISFSTGLYSAVHEQYYLTSPL